MSYDDTEDANYEETPIESAAHAAERGVTLQITGYDVERIEALVVAKLADGYQKGLDKRGAVNVESVLTKALDAFIRDKMLVEAEKVLAEGWRKTDEYGSPKGEKLMLRDRISAAINIQDRYNNNRSWLDSLVREQVEKLLGAEFKREMEEAKASFRKQVDELLTGKIAEGLRGAFGLSR
jgi:hypothetical protein